MNGWLETAGERLTLACDPTWVGDLLAEGAAGLLQDGECASPSAEVRVESTREPFDTRGWEPASRGVWRRGEEVVVENACTAGFDLHLACHEGRPTFTYRWRPPTRDRVLALAARSRFHLLARAVLVQFPALWCAGLRGRAPLHASACVAGESTPLVACPSGVGRSTLLLRQLAHGGRATSDNLGVSDGVAVWGLVEPVRVSEGEGRRMPHGRRETALDGRVAALIPDCVVVLRRDGRERSTLVRESQETAVRSLVTSTYMAGELRRYWAFAATLSAVTGLGPAHSPVTDVAGDLADGVPCFTLHVGTRDDRVLGELLQRAEVATWA